VLGFNLTFLAFQKYSVTAALQASLRHSHLPNCYMYSRLPYITCVDEWEMKSTGHSSLSLRFGQSFGSDETWASVPTPVNAYELYIQWSLNKCIFSVLQRQNSSTLRCFWACLYLWAPKDFFFGKDRNLGLPSTFLVRNKFITCNVLSFCRWALTSSSKNRAGISCS